MAESVPILEREHGRMKRRHSFRGNRGTIIGRNVGGTVATWQELTRRVLIRVRAAERVEEHCTDAGRPVLIRSRLPPHPAGQLRTRDTLRRNRSSGVGLAGHCDTPIGPDSVLFAIPTGWLTERLRVLASVMAIDEITYTVLGNHRQAFIRNRPSIAAKLTDREVAKHLRRLNSKRFELREVTEKSMST